MRLFSPIGIQTFFNHDNAAFLICQVSSATPGDHARYFWGHLAIFPELAPPEVRATWAPTVGDVLPLVIEEGCGLRPAKKDGIRLEVE